MIDEFINNNCYVRPSNNEHLKDEYIKSIRSIIEKSKLDDVNAYIIDSYNKESFLLGENVIVIDIHLVEVIRYAACIYYCNIFSLVENLITYLLFERAIMENDIHNIKKYASIFWDQYDNFKCIKQNIFKSWFFKGYKDKIVFELNFIYKFCCFHEIGHYIYKNRPDDVKMSFIKKRVDKYTAYLEKLYQDDILLCKTSAREKNAFMHEIKNEVSKELYDDIENYIMYDEMSQFESEIQLKKYLSKINEECCCDLYSLFVISGLNENIIISKINVFLWLIETLEVINGNNKFEQVFDRLNGVVCALELIYCKDKEYIEKLTKLFFANNKWLNYIGIHLKMLEAADYDCTNIEDKKIDNLKSLDITKYVFEFIL